MISVYGCADENVGTISTWKLLYREKSHKGVVKNTYQIGSLDLLKWQTICDIPRIFTYIYPGDSSLKTSLFTFVATPVIRALHFINRNREQYIVALLFLIVLELTKIDISRCKMNFEVLICCKATQINHAKDTS